MCGICGFWGDFHITQDELRCMNDSMYHRGPNDSGEEIVAVGQKALGLAQRRLSILDLSPLGHQPMHSPDRSLSVVFNGEIYNFLELKEELSEYSFTSNCDTEVILAAYRKWGANFVDHITGMFAIALFDHREEKLYLVRDRIGKKPLYYWLTSKGIVFASELKPILLCPGFEKKIDTSVLNSYFIHQYINAPKSIFENVYKLEPGAILEYTPSHCEVRKYWNIPDVYHQMLANPVRDYAEAKDTLKSILTEAVRKRMIADVPLGTFLSGGYDSSLVTAIAQELSDRPMKTFCIGFNTPKFNEAEYAKAIAKHLGTDHTELYIGEEEMFDLVDSLAQFYDEPFADSSQIPTMLVSKLAKEDVTVALSGDGGDELFCGYNNYAYMGKAQKLDVLGGMVNGICHLPGLKQAKLINHIPFPVRVIASNRNKEAKTQFGSDNYVLATKRILKESGGDEKFYFESRYREKNWQKRRMLLDEETYLPGDILCKVDRASMKYSLETRCPILDQLVIEYSYRLPHSFKYYKGDKKHILKDIAYDYIPKELLERPKKGFSIPLDQWLRGPLKEKITAFSEVDFLKRQGVFDPEETTRLVRNYLEMGDQGPGTGRNYSVIVWPFFVFQQWYQKYMNE